MSDTILCQQAFVRLRTTHTSNLSPTVRRSTRISKLPITTGTARLTGTAPLTGTARFAKHSISLVAFLLRPARLGPSSQAVQLWHTLRWLMLRLLTEAFTTTGTSQRTHWMDKLFTAEEAVMLLAATVVVV